MPPSSHHARNDASPKASWAPSPSEDSARHSSCSSAAVSSQSSGPRRGSAGWAAREASSEASDSSAACSREADLLERCHLPPPAADACASAEKDPLHDHPRYRKLRSVNHGAHGFVQLALDTQTMQRVAIKFMQRGGFSRGSALERECARCTLAHLHDHRQSCERTLHALSVSIVISSHHDTVVSVLRRK